MFISAGITDIITHRDASNVTVEIEVQLEIIDDDDALGGHIEKDQSGADVRVPGRWKGAYRFIGNELAILLTLQQPARRDAIVARMKTYLKERYQTWKHEHNINSAPVPAPTKADVSTIAPLTAVDLAP